MLTAFAAIVLSASNPALPAAEASSGGKVPYRQCRWLVKGSSASGDVKICRTKAEWRQWEMCNSATSYCSAEQKAQRYGGRTAFALSEDSRVICRIVKGTGSRLSSTKICLPQREWQRQWDEASAATFDMQDRSMLPEGPK